MMTRETELKKLWMTVLATARIRDGLASAIAERIMHSLSVFQPQDLTDSERYIMEQANRHLEEAKTAHREAYLINKIRELEEQLRLAKIRCTVCGEYFPGHATGGADICTCV